MIALVTRRLEHDDPSAGHEHLTRRARLVTMVSIATMRSAWLSWAGGPATDLGPLVVQSFADLRELLTQ